MKTPPPESPAAGADALPAGLRPAGFWRRHAAWTLDAALLALPTWWLASADVHAALADCAAAVQALAGTMAGAAGAVFEGAAPQSAAAGLLADASARQAIAALQGALFRLLAVPALAFALLSLLWHVGFEASALRATPGQRALGLRVGDAAGRPLHLLQAAWRHLAGTASWLTLNTGHAMAAIPPRHLALHDHLSQSRVLAPADARWPAWTTLWIALQVLAMLAGCVWLFVRLQAAMEAALGV